MVTATLTVGNEHELPTVQATLTGSTILAVDDRDDWLVLRLDNGYQISVPKNSECGYVIVHPIVN